SSLLIFCIVRHGTQWPHSRCRMWILATGEGQGLMPQVLQSGPALLPALLHETQTMPAATAGQSTAALPRYISHRSFQRLQACLHLGAEVAHAYFNPRVAQRIGSCCVSPMSLTWPACRAWCIGGVVRYRVLRQHRSPATKRFVDRKHHI